MSIIGALNEYFGTECESINEFRHHFDEIANTYEQSWKLLGFLSWLERQQNS